MAHDISRQFIQGLPKAELHLHVEGTLEPELKLKLAQRNHIDIGFDDVESIRNTYNFSDLPSFLDVYYEGMKTLVTEQDFYDLAWEYLLKAQENSVRHVELFFDPQAHASRGVDIEDVLYGLLRACSDARALGVDAELIMCFLRDFSAESARLTFEAVSEFADHLIGVGLDSDEHNNPPLKFFNQFAHARELGLHVTAHADIDQKDSIEHIKQLLEVIDVERIDHGTNIVEDPDLVELAAKRGVGLTSCPISNTFCGNDTKQNEVKDLLNRGVQICINSDDPAYFGGYICDNYEVLAQSGVFSREDIIELVKNSFRMSWISDERKALYLQEIDAYVAHWDETHA